MHPAPSGAQHQIRLDDLSATVVEIGGGLRTFTQGEWDLLDGYAEDRRCSAGRGQPLIPWPNRLAGGKYTFESVSEQAPITEPALGNAIHGLTRWLSWDLVSRTDHSATMGLTLRPQPGWAWSLELRIHYVLVADGLEVTTTAINLSDTACPFGLGFHPYLKAPSGRVDDLTVRLPAATRFVADELAIPVVEVPTHGSELDFTHARPIGDQVIDVAFSSLHRDADGLSRVEVTDPGSGRSITLELDPQFGYVMLFTGDTLGAASRRGLAVEPMTCPANMLATGQGLIRIPAGGSWSGSWALRLGSGR